MMRTVGRLSLPNFTPPRAQKIIPSTCDILSEGTLIIVGEFFSTAIQFETSPPSSINKPTPSCLNVPAEVKSSKNLLLLLLGHWVASSFDEISGFAAPAKAAKFDRQAAERRRRNDGSVNYSGSWQSLFRSVASSNIASATSAKIHHSESGPNACDRQCQGG